MSDTITLCYGCKKNRPLQPFWKFIDAEYWWLGQSDNNPKRLCSACHAAAVEDREMNSANVPSWYWLAIALKNYIPPPPVLTLKQTDLI